MNRVRKIAAVGMSLFVLAGCSEKTTTKIPAPPTPTPAMPPLVDGEAPEPLAGAAARDTEGRVLALPFTEDFANKASGGISIRIAGNPSKVEAGRFGSGCRLEKGATLCVPTLPMTAEGTWGLWVCPDARQAESVARIMDANSYGIFLTGSKISIAYNDGKSVGLPGPGIPAERWTHIAMTWGDGSLKLYINGELHGQRVIKGAPQFPARKLFIGSRWTGSELTFTGAIDDVVIYNRAISAEEIKVLVEQGLR